MKIHTILAIAMAVAGFSSQAYADLNGDIKRPVFGLQGSMSSSNYQTILNGIDTPLKCNSIRLGFDPNKTSLSQYSQLFKDVRNYASSIGLNRYINPLGTGNFGKSNSAYASWIQSNVTSFNAGQWGAFNESGFGASTIISISNAISAGGTRIGPDPMHTDSGLSLASSVKNYFGIYSSHNAANDQGATSSRWSSIKSTAGKSTWASENPRTWSFLNSSGQEVGVKAAKDGGMDRIVLYLAYPNCVTTTGSLTSKGSTIASNF